MNVMIQPNSIMLWQDVVREAEKSCSINLENSLENYLSSLLFRYIERTDVVHNVVATSFLEALQQRDHQRHESLQEVGDHCLLLTGLFPQAAKRRCVKIRYFVDLGQTAYDAISHHKMLYHMLALHFVALMDVLQSIRQCHELLPLEAYEQWHELGSQRALKILQSYTNGFPFKFDHSSLK